MLLQDALNPGKENIHNDDTDIPYTSHEGIVLESKSDSVTYYNTKHKLSDVKIQPNPSYNINRVTSHTTMESSGDQYVYVDNPGPVNTSDDIYDDVSISHDYLAVVQSLIL